MADENFENKIVEEQSVSEQAPIAEKTEPTNNNGGSTSANGFDSADIEKNKTMAGLAYFLFFLPLIACPNSKFAKFHANQSLILILTSVIGYITLGILSLIPFIGLITIILTPLFGIGVFVLGIIGLINGFTGKTEKLPVLKALKFEIIK